jgi:hypothetical protein
VYKLLFFVIGLPTFWLVSEGIMLLPSTYTASLIDYLINFAPTFDKLIITYVFNFSELLISFFIVLISLFILVKLFKDHFIESKYYYLAGNVSGYIFLLFFVLFLIEYDIEGIIIFSEKILFHLVGIVLAWFAVTQGASKPISR